MRAKLVILGNRITGRARFDGQQRSWASQTYGETACGGEPGLMGNRFGGRSQSIGVTETMGDSENREVTGYEKYSPNQHDFKTRRRCVI